MKKLLPLIGLIFITNIYAQKDSTRIFIKAGQSLDDVVSSATLYRYPNFVPGKILFRNESQTNARINYNFLNGEVEFISIKGDTLAIAKEQMLNIRQVHIDSSVFYYSDGYLEEVAKNQTAKLLKKEKYKVSKREKIGGYDQPSSTSAISTLSIYYSNGQYNNDLKVREDITLTKAADFYFGDHYNTFVKASKKNLLRLFSKKQAQIENYFRDHEVDFKNEKDLLALLAFLNQS